MSSSSPTGNPSVLRNAGSLSFSRSFARKYVRRASSVGNDMPRHSTGPLAASFSASNRCCFVCFAISSIPCGSAFQENLRAGDPLDLGGVDAAVRPVLGRDNPVEVAVVLVPLPLALPLLLVGR